MDTAPVTFVHGDFRLDNVLFGQRPEHAEIVIIDWQGPLLAKGVLDVALLLGQNTLIDVRRDNERALLQRYVDGLAKLGVGYRFEDAWRTIGLRCCTSGATPRPSPVGSTAPIRVQPPGCSSACFGRVRRRWIMGCSSGFSPGERIV